MTTEQAIEAAGGWGAVLATYERDGFVVLHGFLSPKLTEELRGQTEGLFEREGTGAGWSEPVCVAAYPPSVWLTTQLLCMPNRWARGLRCAQLQAAW